MSVKVNEKENLTLSLYLESFQEPLFVKYSKFDQSFVDSLDPYTVKTVVSIILVSYVVGSYFKSAIYQHMYDQGKQIINKPIDILILVQALVVHLSCILMFLTYTIGLVFDITFSEYLGEAWCHASWYSSVFCFGYRFYSGLGIAIVRLLYIKSPHCVKDNGLRMRLVTTIILCTVAIAAVLTIAIGIENGQNSRRQVSWNFCIGKSQAFREVVNNYSVIRGTTQPGSDLIGKVAITTIPLAIVAEIICYIFFFEHLYSHNEGLLSREVLPLENVKQRHRVNAFTFVVQFYHFLVEMALVLIAGYTMQNSSKVRDRLLMVVCFWVEFGVLSVVEVMVSSNLRKKLPHNRYLL